MADELDELLGEDTGGSQSGTPPEKKPDTTDGGAGSDNKGGSAGKAVGKATESIRKEMEEVRKERREALEREAKLAAEVERLSKLVKPIEQMSKPPEEPKPDLGTTEGWMNVIKKESSEAQKPVLSEIDKFKSAQKSKALKAFVKAHPEYSLDKGKEKLQGLLSHYDRIKSRGDMDADEIAEDLKDAWALQNRGELEHKAYRMQQERDEAERTAAELATSGGGTHQKVSDDEVEATPMQRKVAAELGIPIGEYIRGLSRIR